MPRTTPHPAVGCCGAASAKLMCLPGDITRGGPRCHTGACHVPIIELCGAERRQHSFQQQRRWRQQHWGHCWRRGRRDCWPGHHWADCSAVHAAPHPQAPGETLAVPKSLSDVDRATFQDAYRRPWLPVEYQLACAQLGMGEATGLCYGCTGRNNTGLSCLGSWGTCLRL